MKIKTIVSIMRTAIERFFYPNYSTCGKCERPWKFVEGHTTLYIIDPDGYPQIHGMFPLCEICWTKLGTPENRMPYYRSLWESWHQWGDDGVKWSDIEKAVWLEAGIDRNII